MADKKNTVAGLKIVAKVDGFRRAGRPWSGETKVALSDLSKEQIAQLRNEPMLTVSDCKMPVTAEVQ